MRQDSMEGRGRQDRKDGKAGQAPKTTTAKLKERWLLTRKTWRYMSDAGKKLFPEGVNPHKTEDIPRVEEHFQKINNRSREFILWPQPQQTPRAPRRRRKRFTSVTSDTTDTADGDDFADTDDEIIASPGQLAHGVSIGVGHGIVPGFTHSVSQAFGSGIGQTIDPGISQAVGPGISQAVGPGISQAVGPGISQVLGPGISQAVGPGISPALGPGISQAVGPGISQAVGPDISQAVGPGISQAVGPGISQAVGPGISQAVGPGISQAVGPGISQVLDSGMTHAVGPGVGYGMGQGVVQGMDHGQYQGLVSCGSMAAGEGMVPGMGIVPGMEMDLGMTSSSGIAIEAGASAAPGMAAGSPGSSPGMYMGATNHGQAFQPGGLPGTGYPGMPAPAGSPRERFMSCGELRYDLPPEIYQQLLRHYGSCNLQQVASLFLEAQLTEEDEDEDFDEPPEVAIPGTRSVGCQTDPHLDMCVQTDDDATAEDMVKVGAESRSVTEATAAAAQAQARAQAQALQQSQGQGTAPVATPESGGSSTSMLKKLWQRRESTASGSIKPDEQPQQLGKDGRKVSDKDREAQPPRGVVAAKLAWAEKTAAAAVGANVGPPGQKSKQEKTPEKSKLKNVFKLGLKCDVEQGGGSTKKTVEKTKIDKFKTVNYDKTLRNIKSKWVPDPESEEVLRQYLAKDEKKVKKKAKGIQVGDPLPQFILAGLRISAPVEIIYQRRQSRRRVSKADSSDFSSSECSMSVPPSLPTSPRYSITVTDEMGTRDMLVSEAEASRLSQMGSHIIYKRSSIDASVDTSEFEPEGLMATLPQYQRSLSALQASGHLAQMIYNVRSRSSHPQVSPGQGSHRGSQGLLQSLLPAVMQRTRSGGSGHASRLVAKKIWRARSKSQSRASAGTTSIWTPMGGCTWASVTGRNVTLENSTLLQLTELERLTLQQLAIAKLQALNLGCQIRVPREQTSSAVQKKRRPYLLKRKALTTGIFDSKKEETKDGVEGGLVFGLSLTKCLEIERSRSREAAERAAAAAAAAAATSAAMCASEEGEPSLSRKSSHAGSHASFSSLIEGTKQSTTGSLESLNLERKRPSLVGGDLLPPGPATPDLLTVEPSPQIPGLVNMCLKHLETNGMHTLGIFRVSSSKKRVRQLREEFDSGREVWLSEDHCPHDVATLLKEFFRDLPEPLLTRELYEPFIKTQKIRNRKLQFEALQHLIQLMPAANRDTLYCLLNFLATVAENAPDQLTTTGETIQGNKMDSSNLATLFAPNILHTVKPGCESMSTSEMATHAEERIEVINVVRSMIDHNKELFEVSPELLDETYHHLMDSHPDALDILLRRRCTGPDDRGQHLQELLASLLAPHRPQSCSSTVQDLEVETSSSVFEGSECSSSLPRSPTDATQHHDFDRMRMNLEENEGARMRRREEVVHEGAAMAIIEQSDRRRSSLEEEDGRGRQRDKTGETLMPLGIEERGWFRKRDKSSSRELDRTSEERQPEKTRWFRKREKSSSRGSDDRNMRRDESDRRQREKAKCRDELSASGSDRRRGKDLVEKSRMMSGEKEGLKPRLLETGEDEWGEHHFGEHIGSQERLRVPEPTVRRLSSPEIDSSGVITASLRIPVPLSQGGPLSFTQDTEIPYIEDGEDKKNRHRSSPYKGGGSPRGDVTRQRSGSSDSYLGQPITGTMSFHPLTKKGGDKQSHDSVLSSSSADVFTLSPSPRNTPLSDLYASGTSSPLSRPSSPPHWLSPDSGTPGLSPPNSPPLQPRRRGDVRNNPLAHSVTHTFGSKPPSTPSKIKASPTVATQGLFPIGRSKTADSIKVEMFQTDTVNTGPVGGEGGRGTRRSSRGEEVHREGKIHRESGGRRYVRRRYTGERHQTGQLPDLSSTAKSESQPSGEGQTQLWKRWEIIASDPTEPETFV
ncbi:uncharacterized protein RhoGAP102A isoform X2 [Panulirus ornatus]|uniref:uncharacterized protein RhoGAP102A isoform X2 n=1 Tax=Panulirus ornatus TaxID=150431 RepID=UPI003A8913C2